MQVFLTKYKENSTSVWYKFEMEIKTGDVYKDKKGWELPVYKPKFGLFKFNKTINLEDTLQNNKNIIEIDKMQTDEYFWDDPIILRACISKMIQCQKNNNIFPDELTYTSCG